jgi:ABC-2 type transport system ATP-binding protein
MEHAILTENLTKVYPKSNQPAIENLNLNIQKGEIFGFLGPNGSGKTTTFKILCTLLLPSSGRAYVNGYDVLTEARKVQMSIGAVMESERSFYWRLTGEENLLRFASYYYIPPEESKRRITELMDKFDLSQHREKQVGKYSRGMKAKLSIIRALLPDPPILFFDEPWLGLDVETKIELKKLIYSVAKDEKRTVFLCSHELALVEEICDTVAIISNGHLLVDGRPQTLIEDVGGKESITVKGTFSEDDIEKIQALKNVLMLTHSKEDTFHITTEEIPGVVPALYQLLGSKIENISVTNISLEDVYLYFSTGGSKK